MEDFCVAAFLHGFLLALGLILPLGAQNVFIFNQGANHKRISKTMPVIITAGLCDTLLIILAILGVSLVLLSLPILQLIVYIIGFIFLIYMAISLWNEKPKNLEYQSPMSAKKQIGFAMSVSLLNPHAIMDTIGVIGTSASIYDGVDKWIFSISTIAVSWLWFILLAFLGKMIGSVDKTGKWIVYLNKLSSVIIVIVAIIILKNIIGLLM
nr:LysE family transporter [Mammaliicoccus vitulinus]